MSKHFHAFVAKVHKPAYDAFRDRWQKGGSTEYEMPVLLCLAMDPRVKVCVEIGMLKGQTTIPLVASGKMVYSVEPEPIQEAVDRIRGMRGQWELIHGASPEVSIPACDLLWIDGLHTYAQVSAELRKYSPKVSTYIALHDTVAAPELMEAIHNFLDDNGGWEMALHLNTPFGMTILKRKPC